MTSTNDGNEVNSNQRSGHRNKSYYIELYKSLEARLNGEDSLEARTSHVCEAWRRVYSLYQHSAPTTHPHLSSWLQRHTAHTVLQSKWAKSKNEHARLTAAIDSLVAEVQAAGAGRDLLPWEQLLLQRAAWFRKALENPWGHPVLKSLIDPNGEPVTDQQVLEWLIEERGVVLVTRLRQLVSAGNCDDLALLLASAVMDRARAATPRRPDDAADDKVEVPEDKTSFVAILERDASFTVDVWELLKDIEFVLLLKTDKRPRCIELAKLTPLKHGYATVERLRNRLETSPRDKKLWKHAKEVATLVTQVIITRCMVLSKCWGVGRAALYCCARSLARLVPAARLPSVSNTLAAAAATARHLHTFCTALDAQCSADMKPFICELYIRAITAGMNELEKLKNNAEKTLEARSCEQMLASWFTQLGALLERSLRLRAECALTAFSVHPAPNLYERVADMPQPPPLNTAQEPAAETTSDFGSWANDSRTQSNLVKTSETLQLKQTERHQANVLSTAVLTEGEILGLEPELCQDLAVLLSVPRVKTLSWDMDREVLLQNCRAYMERTHGGTRAVTTELKYLNLDPSAYRHLPEEDDEETGIERGYEHELPVETPEEIWQDAFFDAEVTESADDSEVEIQISKKKTKAPVSSDDEEDPLSCIADAKKEKKKLAKEKSKEQRRKKTHKRDTSKDGSRDRRKDKDKKTKKESKKNKSEQPTTGSLTSLLGMKVTKMTSLVQDGEKRVRKKKERRRDTMFSYVSVTDSDYDSQEKSSQKSDNDPNIVVDGVFSMDELKSPDRQSSDSQKTIDNMKPTIKTYGIAHSTVINDIKSRPKVSSPKVSTTSDNLDVSTSKSPYLTPNLTKRHVISSKVKTSITSKLLQYRRNKSLPRPVSRSPAPSTQTQTLVGMKIYNADEIPKVCTNKKQPESASKEVGNSSNLVKETGITVINRPHVPYNETVKTDNKLRNLYNVQKHSQDYNTAMHAIPKNVFNEGQNMHNEYVQISPTKAIQHSNYMTNQSPTNIHTNYVSPVKTADHMSSQALNLSPPKTTMVYQTFHKSMQNLSTDNMKCDKPKRPVLINDPNYHNHQHAKSNYSQLSPKIISNTCIKPPNETANSSQLYAKDDFTKLSHDSVISRGYVQYVNSQVTNSKSEIIRCGSKQLSSSMQDVNVSGSVCNNVTKKHIPSPIDTRLGHTSQPLPYSMKLHSELSNISHTFRTSNSAPSSRSTSTQNRERIDIKNQKNVLAASHNPVGGVKSNIQEFFDNLTKSINAGSSSPETNLSIALNKDVKVTPVQVPSTSITAKRVDSSPQCAKQLIQQKKPENAPNTFSRRSYMHKNKQSENKVVSDSLSLELNKNIMDHKLTKAKCINNELVISRVSMNDGQTQGNIASSINQSSTKMQKACPLLTSMLDSPGKLIGKCQTISSVSNIATTHKPSENQTDREHADLLLLLRQQPVVKPNPNTPVILTSGITSSQNSSNTQTKVVTQVPLAHKTLIGAKVKNYSPILGNTPSVQKDSTSQNNAPLDWRLVMDALSAHKTEPLGPNALDMVLKKEYKKHGQSSSRSHTSHNSRTSGQSSSQSKSDSRKRELHNSKPSSSSRKPSTGKHSEVPKRHRQSEKVKKVSSTEMLKRVEAQNKCMGSNSLKDDDPFISGIPNSAYDMLGDLIDDDLRQELGELSSDEDAYSTPKLTVTKEKSSNIPKTGTSVCKVSNVAKENPRIVDPKIFVCKSESNPKMVDTNRKTYSTTGYPHVIMNNSGLPDDTTLPESRSTVISSIKQQHTTTVITSQIVQPNTNMANHTIIGPNHFVNNFEPTNVIITSVPAQPVVVIRQDLVYDPYPTIRIHESQVSAGICSVNQNVYALNSTPNIAVYQTTQFAAPVVNPVIIGNAMTSTNVSDAVAMADQQRTSDSVNEEVNPQNQEVEDSVDPEIANRLSEDKFKMPERSITLDFNMNKNCERKVLSQMQENHLSDNFDMESQIQNLSVDDYPLKTKQDEERIKLKRQSLLNRKISHACYHPPIPLTYTPISKKVNVGKLMQQETPKNCIVKPNHVLIPNTANGIEKCKSTDSSIQKSPNLEVNNENIQSTDQVSSAKENQKSCRRIWLRSSNKLENIKSPVKRTRIPLRRNKFKLKVTKKGIEKLTNLENDHNVKNVTRVSSRILNKNKLQESTSDASPVERRKNSKKNEEIGLEKDKPLSPGLLQQNVESNELIDFEQELSSSKILKTSTAVIETKEPLEQVDSNNITDYKQIEIDSGETIAEKQNNLDDIKETNVAPESDKPTNDDLKPTVVIERLKNKVGSQLVIKSLSVKASEVDPNDMAIKNKNLTILADKSISNDKPADMTTVQPKNCIDMKQFIQFSPHVQRKTQATDKKDETLKNIKTTAAETLLHQVMMKAANTVVQRKSNRHTKSLNSEVSTQSINKTDSKVTGDNNHTLMTIKDRPIVIDQLQAKPLPESKYMQLSNRNLKKSNSTALIANKKQQIETNVNKSLLCREKITDVLNNVSVPNTNAITEKRDIQQLVNCQPTNLNQQANTRTPMLNVKPRGIQVSNALPTSKTNARQSKLAKDENNDKRRIYTKDDMTIEELPINDKDTGVKKFRISLPDGKVLKVTIAGKIHGDFDSLFEQPSMKSILAGGFSDVKKYTLNYTQVSETNKANPTEICTRIQNMQIDVPVATVNLISDDEDEVELVETHNFSTEFGKYTTNVDQDAFNKHQKKFTQKCEVKLIKDNILKLKETKPKVKFSPSLKSSLLTRNMSKMVSDAATTTNMTPEVDSNVKYDDDVLARGNVNSTNNPTSTQETTTSFKPFSMAKSTLLIRNQSKLVASSISSTIITPEFDSKIKQNLPEGRVDSTDKLITAQETTTDPMLKNTVVTGNQIKLVTNATFTANMLSDCYCDIKESSPPPKVDSTHSSTLAQETTTQNKLEANATLINPEADCFTTNEDSLPAKINSTDKSTSAQETAAPSQKSGPAVIRSTLIRNLNKLEANETTTSSMISEFDSNSKNNDVDLPPVYVDSTNKPKCGQGTSTPLRVLPTVKNPALLTKDQSQQEFAATSTTKTIPGVDSYTKDDGGDLLPVSDNYTMKSTLAQNTCTPLKSDLPVKSSVSITNQNKLESDAITSANIITENDFNTIDIEDVLPPVHVIPTNAQTPTQNLSTSLEQADEVHTTEAIEIDATTSANIITENDFNTIDIEDVLPPVHMIPTNEQMPTQKLSTSLEQADEVHTTEAIEIDATTSANIITENDFNTIDIEDVLPPVHVTPTNELTPAQKLSTSLEQADEVHRTEIIEVDATTSANTITENDFNTIDIDDVLPPVHVTPTNVLTPAQKLSTSLEQADEVHRTEIIEVDATTSANIITENDFNTIDIEDVLPPVHVIPTNKLTPTQKISRSLEQADEVHRTEIIEVDATTSANTITENDFNTIDDDVLPPVHVTPTNELTPAQKLSTSLEQADEVHRTEIIEVDATTSANTITENDFNSIDDDVLPPVHVTPTNELTPAQKLSTSLEQADEVHTTEIIEIDATTCANTITENDFNTIDNDDVLPPVHLTPTNELTPAQKLSTSLEQADEVHTTEIIEIDATTCANTITENDFNTIDNDDVLPPVHVTPTNELTSGQKLSTSLGQADEVHTTEIIEIEATTSANIITENSFNTKAIDDILPSVHVTPTNELTPAQKLSTSLEQADEVHTTEIIEIDDSSNDSVENLTSKSDSNRNVESEKEIIDLNQVLSQDFGVIAPNITDIKQRKAVNIFKNALLHDIGIMPMETSVIDITGDEDDMEKPIVIQKQSNVKECVIKLMNCDNLIKRYALMKTMKRCYVKLERLNNSILKTASVVLSKDVTNNEITDERIQDNDEDFIEFDVEETSGFPQLSRCPSLSILDNWDDECHSSPVSPYQSSPVMEIYDTLAQLGNELTDEANLVNKSENLFAVTCDSEWTMTKFGYRNHEMLHSSLTRTSGIKRNDILSTDCESMSSSDDEKLLTTSKAPTLLTITLKFLEDNPDIVYKMQSMRKIRRISIITPSNKLKRKFETLLEDTVANKILKLGTLAVNALNTCFKSVDANHIPQDKENITYFSTGDETATFKEIIDLQLMADFVSLSGNEIIRPDTSEIALKVPVTDGQNTNTPSSARDYDITVENIKYFKRIDELENIESIKPKIVEIDLKSSITKNQASSSEDSDMTITYVEKIEDSKQIVDSVTLSDIENNTLENNDIAQKAPVANTISGTGDCYTATTQEKIRDLQIVDIVLTQIENNRTEKNEMNLSREQYQNGDECLSSTINVGLVNEHINTYSEDPPILLYDTNNSEIGPTLIKTEHRKDSTEGATHYDEKISNIVDESEIAHRTLDFTEEKYEEMSTFKDENIYENIDETKINNDSSIDDETNITGNNTEMKNNIDIETLHVTRSLTPEDTVQSNNKKLEEDIDPDAVTAIKTDSEGVEPSDYVGIYIQFKQAEFYSKIVNNSPELDNKNKNKPEENHTPVVSTIQSVNEEKPVNMNYSSEQAATESSNVANIYNNVRLDEIPVDDLCNEVYEVEVVESNEEDCINMVETLCVRSPESIPVNDSLLKSPIFIDNKEIFFNYHDYTKLPKQKENTVNHSHEDIINKHNSDNLNEECSSETDVKAPDSCINVTLKEDPPCEDRLDNQKKGNNIIENSLKIKPHCKYELIQKDDWLTVITTENDKNDNETRPVLVSPSDVLEDTIVVASVRSKNASINIKGFEYDDVYVFPLSESGSNSNTSNDSLSQEFNIKLVNGVKNNLHDIDFGVLKPHVTYAHKCIKRKISMRDVKVPEKKYRKGKNIDCSKQTVTSMNESAYSKEYKRLLEYCSSVKFSYSRPFHKECVEVEDLMSKWPITGALGDVSVIVPDVADDNLFANLEELDMFQPDPATQTLGEEISYGYKTDAAQETVSSELDEANFNMGFGEGSGRVIQILKKGGESNISAATLSDVKQSQPVFKSVDLNECNNFDTNRDDLIMKIRKHFNFIELRDRVRSFFEKSSVDLKSNWMQQNIKDNVDLKWRYNNTYHAEEFPFDLCSLEYMKPLPTEAIVQVVQVGQLPVSAAAQNPVTCDPRVTQVSDASPSQCSVDNSPNDDSQSDIKTEYTELTTADLTLPLQEYAQQNQAMNLASHESNVELTEQTISLEMEIKAEDSPEIKEEMPDINEEKSNSSDTDLCTLTNATPENIDYSFKNNADKSNENNVIYESSDQNFSQQRQQNGTSEKTDQIAHAMNAAGITTTSETVTNTRAHALVNILSQKMRHGSVNTTQTATNTYSKTTSINAMALQHALAQILPPPLNQTGSSENNQTQSPVGPQVLHIVQGKNASGNQITLLDNSQQSVISTPNATQVLHIVQNKGATAGQASNGTLTSQANSFSGLSLVDAGLQQGGNQLLHIVNTGNQKTSSPGQLLKRVNLLTNLTNVQGSNEQKMVQFVCKSADGKAIQLNAPHQRSMVLRLQPIESPPAKPAESQEPSQSPTGSTSSKDSASQQEIKSRSIYEENYAKFIQNSSSKTPGLEKSTSLPKFNQAFGKPVFQEGSQKQGENASNNSHLPPVNTNIENAEGPATDNAINLEHISQIGSPPLLIRKPAVTSQSQSNIVQQIKQTIAPMNIQTMHGGVIYTRQIPVNIGGGQTINLITVPSTELINDETPKTQTQTNQSEIEPSIIKIVPQSQSTTNTETSQEESNNHTGSSNDSAPTPQPQPVLTQMRIKLPMLSKAPQMVPGARVVRPSFFQIQRNVIGGANQPVYQQLVLTAAPPLGQQTIRLPQAQAASRPIKVPSEGQSSSSESQMSSSTLEQLREFDMVLEQVKERSTVQPTSNSNNNSFKIHTSSSDTTDGNGSSNCSTESTPQVLYSIGNNQSLNVTYVNRKTTVTTPTTSTYVRSPDSSGIADSPTSSTHVQIPHTVTTDSSSTEMSQSKPAKVGSKSKSRPKSTSNPPNTLKLNSVPPKTSSQKPLEDEQTTQRILYILAEYKEQVENSPDKDKPAPRRRSNPPSNPGSSKRKKSSSSRRSGRDMSPVHGEDTCRTMGSEDSSCGTSQGDCNESCLDSHSPQDSPRKVARKITFDQDLTVTQPRPQQQRNVIVADGQTITVARGTTGKPATAVLMPANYILPVSMVKGGQQIAIVTNRGPKLLTVGGEGGATNALLLQRLIGPAGLKPVLARPGVRHVRLPTAALHNLQAFNLATATTVQPPDSTASPTSGPTPPELVDTRATSSPWTDRDSHDVKPERGSSPEGSEPWNLPSSADAHEYSYEETVRTDNMDRTVLVVQKKDGSQRQHRLSHVSAAALRHKYAILEHELRLQKSLSEECEDLGVDSPSASELFPEAELLFAASPAHEHNQDPHHSHTPQPIQSSIPQPDMDDQIATDHLIPREIDVSMGLGDVGVVAVSEDGMSATIALDQEEFARSHPNTTFHSEPTEGEVQPFTITGLKGRHITSTIFHSNSAPATVLMAAPQTTVISQAPDQSVKYQIENMINSMPSSHNNDINLSSVLVKDDGLTRFDSILTDSRELHLSNTASAIVHSSGNATQVIRRVCYEDDKRERDARFLIDEPDNLIAGDDAKMVAEDNSRDATLESMADVDDDRSSPERHAELFWESNSASERSEGRRPLDFSSDSDKCCKSPSFDETNSTDSSGVGTHMRLDSVIKEARGRERSGSADGSSADDTHPPLRTYPPKRMYHPLEGDVERSLSGKTRAGERSPDSLEVRRRASGRGVVKRGCHCCNGSPAPPRPKKPRQRKPTLDFNTNN